MPKLSPQELAVRQPADPLAAVAQAAARKLADLQTTSTIAEASGTRLIVSYSELDSYRQCPLKWELGYHQRWSKPVREGGALDKGTTYHTAMETHYNAIRELRAGPQLSDDEILAECRSRVLAGLLDSRTSEWLSETHELIGWMYDGYVDRYGCDPQWEIVGVELGLVMPLTDPRTDEPSQFDIKAKLDLVVIDRSLSGAPRLWVVDHKSGKDLPQRKVLDIDDQFALYSRLLRRQGLPVFGAIHNANRTYRLKTKEQPLDDRMKRTLLTRTDDELSQVEADALLTAMDAYRDRSDAAGIGVGGLGVHSAPDPGQCGWKCDFLDAHLMMRQGADPVSTLEGFNFTQTFRRH